MKTPQKPARWRGSDEALHAVQVAFDVEATVLEAVRCAAFIADRSSSDQIRSVLGLPVSRRTKRPRLTVTLTTEDYAMLAEKYGLDVNERLAIKEQVTRDLINFAKRENRRKK
ncbi:MAG: hypothetical protein LBB51_02285 [Zoogloeaceae bacterium]|jgi:hypothetical protein|nr:hypothetical protein [Zoogloeaceae bacterium]